METIALDSRQATSNSPSFRVCDLHADTLTRIAMGEYPPYSTEGKTAYGSLTSNDAQISVDRMGGVPWAQCYAVWTPDECPMVPIDWFRTSVAWFHAQMDACRDRMEQARTFADIPRIVERGKVAAVLTVENASIADDDLRIVDEFARDGVLIAGITWNGRNALGSGNDTNGGLTDLGKRYVAALEERGIVVDASHLNEPGFWDVERLATKPYIATHSNARAVVDHPRNLTDDQFRAIAARGGLVGLNFHEGFVHRDGQPYTFDHLAAHVEHWLDLGGEDAIALGSDRDGSDIPDWLADCSEQGALFAMMADRFGDQLARKLFFDNALRFFGSCG